MSKRIPASALKEIVSYDPETGLFTYLPRPLKYCKDEQQMLAINAKYAGKPAFTTLSAQGYCLGGILGVRMYGQRVAWAISHGKWPNEIDHINGDRADNRLENLREVTRSQNNMNCKPKGGSSRFKGVTFDKEKRLWAAQIKADGQRKFLGRYSSEEDAAHAYDDAANKHFGEFARLNLKTERFF